MQQIDKHPKFPSIADNIDFSFESNDGRFSGFGSHEHPGFSQISGGRLPSVEEIKNINQPHKLLTSDPGRNQNNYNVNGHVIDGSRKRQAKHNGIILFTKFMIKRYYDIKISFRLGVNNVNVNFIFITNETKGTLNFSRNLVPQDQKWIMVIQQQNIRNLGTTNIEILL